MGAFQQWLFKTEEDPQLVPKVLFHPVQQATVGHLEALASRVRALGNADDCFNLQEELLGLIYAVEKIESEASQKLRADGYDLAIRAEQFAAGRGSRQLRTIGDALAWMVLGGDRRVLVALSENDQPGRIFGKGERGLRAELEMANRIWNDGHFPLLHDATNYLRIDDITVCNRLHRSGISDDHEGCPDVEYGLLEVKADRHKKASSDQRKRHDDALAAINRGADIKGKAGSKRQFRWDGGYSNHEDALAKVVDSALADGSAAVQVEEGWVMTAVRLVTVGGSDPPEPLDAVFERWVARRDDALTRAGFLNSDTFNVRSGDHAGRLRRCLPFALYPMSERAYAMLTSDWLMLHSALSVDYLNARLQAAGLKTRRLDHEDVVIAASIDDHEIHLRRPGLEDALLEGVSIDTLAAAIAAWAAEPGFEGRGELVLSLS